MNNDRLSHWIALVVLCWLLYFAFLGIPIFNMLLGVSILKVACFAFLCGGIQLALTPWVFFARGTAANPAGRVGHKIAAAAIWFLSTALLLIVFLQYGKDIDRSQLRERILVIGGTAIMFGLIASVGAVAGFKRATKLRRESLTSDRFNSNS